VKRVSSQEKVTSVLQPGVKSSNKHKVLCGLQKKWPWQGQQLWSLLQWQRYICYFLGVFLLVHRQGVILLFY